MTCVCCALQEEPRSDSYRNAVQPPRNDNNDADVPAGKKKKKKKDKKAELEKLKQEVEMVRKTCSIVVSTVCQRWEIILFYIFTGIF